MTHFHARKKNCNYFIENKQVFIPQKKKRKKFYECKQ